MSQEAGDVFDLRMGQLCAAWNHPNTPELLSGYWVVLGRFSAKQLEQAFVRTLNEAKRWPSPAEIRDRIDPEPERDHAGRVVAPWTEEQKAEARHMTADLQRRCRAMAAELSDEGGTR